MSKKSLLKTGIIGVLFGAIAGVLFAPKSGKETRQDIKDAAIKANKEAEKKLKELHSELKEKAALLKDKATTLKGRAKQESDELRSRADDVRGQVSKLISSVREFEADDKDVEKLIDDAKVVLKKMTDKLDS